MNQIVSLPLNGTANTNADIAAHLREQADNIEQGMWDDVRNIYLVIESKDGHIARQTCGAPCDLARAIGVLSIAAARAASGD